MSNDYDFAITGTTPLAACLAGMLAKSHGARVCLIGTFPHKLRIHRGFDLCLVPATQPQFLKLLRSCLPEALQMIGGIGDGKSFERIDPVFTATGRAGSDMLAIMRNIADNYGFRSEPLPSQPNILAGFQFRNVVRVLRRPLVAAIPDWLDGLGVVQVPTDQTQLTIGRGGSAQIEVNGHKFSADRLILAGNNALMRHGDPIEVDKLFKREPTTVILAEPMAAIGGRVINVVDQGLIIHQRPNGALDCVGAGEFGDVVRKIKAQLPAGALFRPAGCAAFQRLRSRDGAPVLANLKPKGPTAIAGFGTAGLFLVPAIARWLADCAKPEEAAYFSALSATKTSQRQSVADFTPNDLEVHP